MRKILISIAVCLGLFIAIGVALSFMNIDVTQTDVNKEIAVDGLTSGHTGN